MDTQQLIRDVLAKKTEQHSPNEKALTDIKPEQVTTQSLTNTNTNQVTNSSSFHSSANATANAAEMMAKQLAELKNKIDSKHKEVKKSKSSTTRRVNKKSTRSNSNETNKQIEDAPVDTEVPPCIERRLRLIIENAKQLTSKKHIKTLKIWLNDLNTKMQLLAMDEVDTEDPEEESED
jgi:hypothetical protein